MQCETSPSQKQHLLSEQCCEHYTDSTAHLCTGRMLPNTHWLVPDSCSCDTRTRGGEPVNGMITGRCTGCMSCDRACKSSMMAPNTHLAVPACSAIGGADGGVPGDCQRQGGVEASAERAPVRRSSDEVVAVQSPARDAAR